MGVRMKADLDPTARYLVLADIDKCLVFVLSLEQGMEGEPWWSAWRSLPPLLILSFGCVSADKRMVKQTVEGVEVSGEDDMIENNDKQEKTVVRLYFVQPKSLQECSIIYDDAAISR